MQGVSTRAEELAVVDWTAEQQAALLRDQFNAQHLAYEETYDPLSAARNHASALQGQVTVCSIG